MLKVSVIGKLLSLILSGRLEGSVPLSPVILFTPALTKAFSKASRAEGKCNE